VDYIKGAYWPRLSVEGVWTRLEQEPEPMLDESTYIGASLTFDLFDGGLRRARVGEARVQQKQAGLFLEDTKRSIAVEVEQSWRNWQTQQSVIESFESRLRYARANFDASERLFEHGAANSVDVIDANTLLVTAEQQLSESRYNLQLALLGIERSTGVYLEGIQDRLKQETAAPESNGQ
jgi:outer membrane protein